MEIEKDLCTVPFLLIISSNDGKLSSMNTYIWIVIFKIIQKLEWMSESFRRPLAELPYKCLLNGLELFSKWSLSNCLNISNSVIEWYPEGINILHLMTCAIIRTHQSSHKEKLPLRLCQIAAIRKMRTNQQTKRTWRFYSLLNDTFFWKIPNLA